MAALGPPAPLAQATPPTEALGVYLDGFHFYSGDLGRQIEAHHDCALLDAELTQCAIYDGNTDRARLIGIEYIISERLFRSLPLEERVLWHSHVHEVKAGLLIAPGVPAAAEHALMERLVSTYGKTWHTWQTDRASQQLPLGIPRLMMGFTADGQIHRALVEARDRALDVDTAAVRARREDIQAPEIAPGADAWMKGTIVRLRPAREPAMDPSPAAAAK